MQQGQTKNLSVTLGNTGNANCTVSALTKSGSADFSYGAGAPVAPFTITPGSSVVVPISYTPSNVGADSGGLQIASNDPANPSVVVALSGTGDPCLPLQILRSPHDARLWACSRRSIQNAQRRDWQHG